MKNLVLHNFRKSKGQFISFGVVIFIAAIILNTALVLQFQTSAAYDTQFKKLNTADVSVAIPKDFTLRELKNEIAGIEGVSQIDEHESLYARATLQNFQNAEFTMNTFFYRFGGVRDLNKYEIVSSQGKAAGKNGIYIPTYLEEMGGYSLGDTMTYVIDGKAYDFTVEGIVSEMQYGNYGTGFIGLYLPDDVYENIAQQTGITPSTEYLIRTESGAKLSAVKSDLNVLLKDKNIPAIATLDKELSKNNRTMISNSIIMILAAFAALVFAVSIFLCRFKIKNTIEEEITEMGILKGIGYTGSVLITSQVVPYLIVCGSGLFLGVGISYTMIPSIANVLAMQSGFSYQPIFDVKAACITIFFTLFAVLVFTVFAAGKIRRLEPINAIVGMGLQKKGKKNHLPLEQTQGPIWVNLILKQMSQSVGQNILLFAVSFVMMILLLFAGILFYNVNIHPNNFLTTLSEELPNVRIQAEPEQQDALEKLLENESGVSAVIYGMTSMAYQDGNLPVIVCEDYSLLENNICYQGRHPKTGMEIAVGSELAKDYAIGDSFQLEKGDKSFEYTVVGYVQSVNNNGVLGELTTNGEEKISDVPISSLNVYLSPRLDTADYVNRIEKDYPDHIVDITNAARETESMKTMYSSLITVVVVVLFTITILIVLLILYVILRTLILRRKMEFGINKAMGFTSKQLILQTLGSITPVIFIASLLSALLGTFYLPEIFMKIFSIVGAVKNNFEYPLNLLIMMAVVLTLVNMIIGFILCRPIRKITAYSLIKEG